MTKKKTGRLFNQAIVALSIVSLVPVLLIGWHVLRMNSRALQQEILDRQHVVAAHIALFVSELVGQQEQLAMLFSPAVVNQKEPVNTQNIKYSYQENAAIPLAMVLNKKGEKVFAIGAENRFADFRPQLPHLLRACVKEKKEYIGLAKRQADIDLMWAGFPLRDPSTSQTYGIFLVQINLNSIGKVLDSVSSKDVALSVVSPKGEIISFAGDLNALVANKDSGFREDLPQILKQLGKEHNGQVKLRNGQDISVSRVRVPQTNWIIYVYRQVDTFQMLLASSFFAMNWEIWGILLIMFLFEVAIAYWVLRPIVRPLRRLKEVTVKLEQEDDYMPTEQDLLIPNNEIGEFEQIFLRMISVLFERKYALQEAKQTLANMNKILEQRVAERTAELNAATEKLVASERLAAIGKMASIISHEIRNPLAVIRNAVRLIKIIQPPVEAKAIKQFSIIESEIRHADGIIGEVLGYVRQRNMLLSRVDLNSYVHEVAASLPPVHEVHIVEELCPDSVQLKIDAEEMKQALRNLISNACESMPEGGQVTVGTKVGRRAVCIYIMDEGPGISEELRENMFLPFYTTKARGTGLGLAIVRKAVSRHKGKLFVYNRPEKGTVFAVYLKIYKKMGDTQYG